MRKRREINVFSISFLDLLSGALGAVIILYVALPKNQPVVQLEDPQKQILKLEVDTTKAKLAAVEAELAELNAKAHAAAVQISSLPVEPSEGDTGSDLDIGFKFKGKNIVFLIDTSYSMIEEDKMGQVKAGLKMLLTSLPPTYRIEVVQYPLGERAPYKSLWGEVRESRTINKLDAFDFIYDMKPRGGTPTRDALIYVMEKYSEMTDLVLLSDGAPSLHNTNKKDDIYDILKVMREVNTRKVRINTIGVGSDFIKDKTSERYKFLNLLAEQTGGFFVGF